MSTPSGLCPRHEPWCIISMTGVGPIGVPRSGVNRQMWLQTRMYLLVALLFAVLYGVIVGIGTWMGTGSAVIYLALALVFLGIQYLIGPAIVGWTMRVKWVTPEEEPDLHRMVAELAEQARLPKPRVGISELSVPNAFAFGRTHRDGRVCVTRGILGILSRDELRAVLGHEMSHIKHRDMAVITLLSAIPMMLHWLAFSLIWGGGRRDKNSYAALIGVGAMLMYFITNMLVLYGSRIREYYADLGSARLGSQPQHLATALYKLSLAGVRPRVKEELKRVEAVKALFVTDPARAYLEVRELSQIDRGGRGVITYDDLMDLRQKEVRLGFGSQMAELFMTHPNMVKRIKHLSSLVV
jgi:heat shock protein HtpX